MKIGSVDLKISILALVVFVLFVVILAITVLITGDYHLLIWGIPTLIMLLIIPLALNYMSQKEYADLEPIYREKAKTVRIRMINESMAGQTVRVEGVIERVYFQFINRPQFLVADRSGEISVKMFTNPSETVKKGDIVEVLGTVIQRYVVTGDAVINCVSIKKINRKIDRKKGQDPNPEENTPGKKS